MDETRAQEAYRTRQERRAALREREGQAPSETEQGRRRGAIQGIPRAQRRTLERQTRRLRGRLLKKAQEAARVAASKTITEEVLG